MRALAVLVAVPLLACAGRAVPDPGPSSGQCVLPAADSVWLGNALSAWTHIGERLLRLDSRPVPSLLLFDRYCLYQVNPLAEWRVTADYHGGRIPLPNGRAIAPTGIGITSPMPGDTGVFLALALPEAWRSDPRYGTSETRIGWERYLTGAFAHEMTHVRMLEYLLPRLRALEAAIYPDTLEDNIVQNRFGGDRGFAQSVYEETDLLYRAVTAAGSSIRAQYVRAALALMRDRWDRYYVGDFRSWDEVEQVFLDLEGVAQWVAFHIRWGTDAAAARGVGGMFDRLLRRFRGSREFWSEDQGLLMILALDALVPGWQRQLLAPNAPTAYELLVRAAASDR